MKRVLIIYELVPFSTKIFDLAVTPDQYAKILKCHGHYINGGDWMKECEWLTDFLNDYPPVYQSDDKIGTFLPYKPENKFDLIIVTGLVV